MSEYKNLDMDEQVMVTNIDSPYWVKKFWRIQMHSLFLLKSLLTIRSTHDVKLAWTGVKSLWDHVKDYKDKGEYITTEEKEKKMQKTVAQGVA